MKYLLKSSDFRYNIDTFKFELTLTEKLRTSRALKLLNIAFQLRSDITAPHCLLLCSNLAQESSQTVYQSPGTHKFQDILALLVENNPGKFVLKNQISVKIQDKDINKLEFWVRTEAGVIVPLQAGQPEPGVDATLDISVVEGIAGLKLFQDMMPNTLLTSSYQETPNLGDSCRYIYQNANALATMVFGGYADFTVSAWGQGRGISSTNSWNYLVDSTMPNKWGGNRFTYVWGMKSPQGQASKQLLFNHRGLIVDLISGALSIQDATGQDQSTGILLLPLKDYIVTISRIADSNGNGIEDFAVTVENLEDNVIQTATVNCGQDPTNQTNWWYSTAQQHFWDQTGVLGPLIAFESIDADDIAASQNWIRQTYNGGVSSSTQPAGSIHSSFAIECDV